MIEAEVQSEWLDIFDRPDDTGFVTGRVHRGDRLRIRADRSAGTGWLAIVPLPKRSSGSSNPAWRVKTRRSQTPSNTTDEAGLDQPTTRVDPVGPSSGQTPRSAARDLAKRNDGAAR